MRQFKNYCSTGDILTVPSSKNRTVEGVVLFASTQFKEIILVAFPDLRNGTCCFSDESVELREISTIIYTSTEMAKFGDWPVTRTVQLFEGYEWLTMRRNADTFLLGDKEKLACPVMQQVDYRFIPMMDCAGRGLVEKCLAFLLDGSNDSKYARRIRDRKQVFLDRFEQLPQVWETLLSKC